MASENLAFFDIDGTLIRELSLLSFYRLFRPCADADPSDTAAGAASTLRREMGGEGLPREARNVAYYRHVFAGLRVQVAESLAEKWIRARRGDGEFWNLPVVERLEGHLREGVRPVLVTGSFREVARVIGRELGVSAWLATPLEERAGRYTGRLTGAPMVGAGKLHAIRDFARTCGASLEASFAYGDDVSDLPMLEAVGHPVVVDGGSTSLLSHAARRGWPVLDPRLALPAHSVLRQRLMGWNASW